jgi:hypothetical protein
MYNSYVHQKRLKKNNDVVTDLEKSARVLELHLKLREKMLQKYKQHLAQRVIDLAVHPVPVYNREITKSPKFKGESIMRLRPRDSKARINDALIKNTILDPSPLPLHIINFRPRHKEKEIQADMKFTPKDRYERLIDKWVSDKEIIYSWAVTPNSKSQIKSTNKKLYYKTLETVALNVAPEACSKDNSMTMLRDISEESFVEELNGSNKEKLGIVAQNALEKCNLRPANFGRFKSATRERL